MIKNLPASVGDTRDTGLIPGSGRSPKVRNGNSLQYSYLESMDRRTWQLQSMGLQRVGHTGPRHFGVCISLHSK